MVESVTWSKRLQQIAKWALISVVGLVALLVALYIVFSAIAALVVLIVLLGAELGLWEWEVSFG